MAKGEKIKIIGCGGIASYLFDALCRYLQYSSNLEDVEITLIDGDKYEVRNASRQKFESGGNKATVTKERLQKEFPKLLFYDVPEYLVEGNVVTNIRKNDIVFLCVDNHKTRKLVSDRAEELSDVTIISGGNDFTDGNILVHIRRDGENLTLPICNSYHPEMMNPQDDNPGETGAAGCEALAAESAPQLVFANATAAALMNNAFYAIMMDEIGYSEAYFDVISNKSRSEFRKPLQESKP